MAEADPETALPRNGAGFRAELKAMQNFAFCKSTKYGDQQRRANREGAHPDILALEGEVIRRCRKLGIPIFAHTIVRTPQEQQRLYVKGVSNAVAGQSPHQYGLAVDFIHGTLGWELTQRQWLLLKHIVFECAASLGLKLRWGGDWDGDGDIHDQKLYDPAHFELLNWRDIGTKR